MLRDSEVGQDYSVEPLEELFRSVVYDIKWWLPTRSIYYSVIFIGV